MARKLPNLACNGFRQSEILMEIGPKTALQSASASKPANISCNGDRQSEILKKNGEIAEITRRRYLLQPWALQLVLHDGETILLAVDGGVSARDRLYTRLAWDIERGAVGSLKAWISRGD